MNIVHFVFSFWIHSSCYGIIRILYSRVLDDHYTPRATLKSGCHKLPKNHKHPKHHQHWSLMDVPGVRMDAPSTLIEETLNWIEHEWRDRLYFVIWTEFRHQLEEIQLTAHNSSISARRSFHSVLLTHINQNHKPDFIASLPIVVGEFKEPGFVSCLETDLSILPTIVSRFLQIKQISLETARKVQALDGVRAAQTKCFPLSPQHARLSGRTFNLCKANPTTGSSSDDIKNSD
ncbi:hypothetical protein K501DRAFT_272106 [Backusella circina FSU 941]|nr:hypothetical protein K501DRAFT_272106 [Backusella circina FSU 941]